MSETEARAGILIRPSSLGEGVYDALLSQLLSLKIPPGARITVDSLARELGVSQTPIREALSRLEADGLVTKTHLVGYRAAPQLTRKQFEDIFEIRIQLEPYAVEKAAGAMSQKALDQLGRHVAAMVPDRQIAAGLAYGKFARQDADFHKRIALGTGNELLADILERSQNPIRLFRLMYHASVMDDAVDEHEAIIAALRERDGRRGAKAMRQHLERSRARLLPIFDQF